VAAPHQEMNVHKIKYVADQLSDSIEWPQKVTKRKFDDKRFIEAVKNECLSTVGHK